MKVREYIKQLVIEFEKARLFYGHGTDNPEDEAVYLVYCLLHIDFTNDEEADTRTLTVEEIELLDSKARTRIEQRTPVAYVVGKAWFAGHMFYSDERALIPRSPIAELVNNRFDPLLKTAPQTVLDLCTGGGCIGLACALAFEDCEVDLVDVSEDALSLAAKNISLHELGRRVKTIHSDLFAQLNRHYDLIVSNPPYVSQEEYVALPDEYQHEPELGLISDEQGLGLPLRILREALDYLQPQGLLIMEVGYSHELLAERLHGVPLLWLEFEDGGAGVLAITASDLRQFRERLN